MTGRIEEVKIDVGPLRQDLQNRRGRVREAEDQVSQLEETGTLLPAKVAELEKAADSWTQRADDLENDCVETTYAFWDYQNVLRAKELLPAARFSPLFAVERAHGLPACPPPPGAPPRPVPGSWHGC